MTISTPKKLAGITAAAGLIIALAGCGSAPDASNTGTAGAGGSQSYMGFLQNGVSLADECLQELYKVANQIGALRIMTKLFLFAWTIATRKNEGISLNHILAAKKVIVSV